MLHFFWHLLLLTVHTCPTSTTNNNTLRHSNMFLHIILFFVLPKLSRQWEGTLFYLLNLVRKLELFWHFHSMNKNVICKKKMITHLMIIQLSLLATANYSDGPRFFALLIYKRHKEQRVTLNSWCFTMAQMTCVWRSSHNNPEENSNNPITSGNFLLDFSRLGLEMGTVQVAKVAG